jgi:hypothetical protein
MAFLPLYLTEPATLYDLLLICKLLAVFAANIESTGLYKAAIMQTLSYKRMMMNKNNPNKKHNHCYKQLLQNIDK